MNLAKVTPPSSSHALERDRLLCKLQEWDEKKLIIIHGQAGQGKTTLVATWLRSLATPAAWYTLDREDADPAVFLAGIAQALQRIRPDLPIGTPALPQSDRSAPQDTAVLQRSIDQTFGRLHQPCLVVLDDYHAIPSPKEFDLLLRTLIDSTPPQVRFIILSRTLPSLEVARLRARRTLGVLTGKDLAFDDHEAHDLFCEVFGMPLERTESTRINRRAEGWPAGLVLTHEYLAQSSPRAGSGIFGADRADKLQPPVFEYLAQEVFSLLAPDLQDFLLRTAITNWLPLPLIQELTGLPLTAAPGKHSVTSMLQELQNRNLFISVADDAAAIRYHSLFHEFLLKKLQAGTNPAAAQKLFTTAIAYFERTGDPVRAIDLSLAAGLAEKTVLLIETHGQEVLARGQVQTLLRWINGLPADEQDRPWFLFFRANALRFSAPHDALLLLDRARAGFGNEKKASCRSTGQIACLCGIIEACFHSGGDFQRMARTASQAQTLLKSTRLSTEARARLLLALGMAWFFIGKLEEATKSLTLAQDLFAKQNDPVARITSILYLAPSALYQGDFRLAREALRKGFEALAAVPDDKASHGALLLIQAMTALFEGKFSEAEENLAQCTALVDAHALGSIGSLALVIGGWLKIAQGDHQGAEQMLGECQRRGKESQDAFFEASAAHLLALSYLFRRKLVKAKAQSDHALSIRTQSGSKLFHAVYLITSGAILMKLGKHQRAEQELLTALKMLQQIKAAQQEANCHLVLAQLYGQTKKKALALRHLEAGFSIGQERRFTYYALFDASELLQLAREAMEQDICTEHCTDLLAILSGPQQTPRLEIYCLGDFRVERDRTVVSDAAWKSKRSKTLLKMLLARDDHKLLRDQVMELLWPEADPEKQRVAYNVMLHRMRKTLEPEGGPEPGKDVFCIQNDQDTLSLDCARVWTDVDEFRKRYGTATRLKRAKHDVKALEAYESMLSVYQGDFLPDDAYNDWAGETRERLRTHYHKALEDAGELAEHLEDKKKAAHFYDLRFASDPCNERSCRWLMTWHLANGHRSEAVRTYERCERALSRDMDMEPEEQTRKIYRKAVGG